MHLSKSSKGKGRKSFYNYLACTLKELYPWTQWVLHIRHGSLALDSALVRKISKRHFFQDIKNSLHGVTRMGLKPHQNFFQNFFSTNMVARGVQSFCILEGATDLLIEQWLKFLCQFTPDMWWANPENFKSISWVVSDLLPFNWKILAIVGLHAYKLAYFGFAHHMSRVNWHKNFSHCSISRSVAPSSM